MITGDFFPFVLQNLSETLTCNVVNELHEVTFLLTRDLNSKRAATMEAEKGDRSRDGTVILCCG